MASVQRKPVNMTRRHTTSGVTLVEVLVVLVLASVIGIASMSMLNAMLRAEAAAEQQIKAIAAVERAFTLIDADLEEAAIATLDSKGIVGIEFTRITDTDALMISYSVTADVLHRTVTQPDGRIIKQTILSHVHTANWAMKNSARTGIPAVNLTLSFILKDGQNAVVAKRLFALTQEPIL